MSTQQTDLKGMARTRLLLGEQAVSKLANARVGVFGLGGVGGYATEILARSGVGNLLLVDFDKVGLSNLNRQIIALHSTVDMFKTEVMKNRVLDINPNCKVEVFTDFAAMETRDQLLQNLDFVVDAIDGLGPKCGLIEECVKRGIKLVSVMGAAGRVDPACIAFDDLSKTHGCSLAKRVRKFLRRRGIDGGVPCVYSNEPPMPPLPPGQENEENWRTRGRERGTQPSVGWLPAMMGMWAASYVVRQLAQ